MTNQTLEYVVDYHSLQVNILKFVEMPRPTGAFLRILESEN
jgi:hypothetical protein